MDISLLVHRVSTHPIEVPVHYNGEEARAMLPELEVEMVDENGKHGSLCLHFRTQSEIAEARKVFASGNTVKLSFTGQVPAITTEAEPAEA